MSITDWHGVLFILIIQTGQLKARVSDIKRISVLKELNIEIITVELVNDKKMSTVN